MHHIFFFIGLLCGWFSLVYVVISYFPSCITSFPSLVSFVDGFHWFMAVISYFPSCITSFSSLVSFVDGFHWFKLSSPTFHRASHLLLHWSPLWMVFIGLCCHLLLSILYHIFSFIGLLCGWFSLVYGCHLLLSIVYHIFFFIGLLCGWFSLVYVVMSYFPSCITPFSSLVSFVDGFHWFMALILCLEMIFMSYCYKSCHPCYVTFMLCDILCIYIIAQPCHYSSSSSVIFFSHSPVTTVHHPV